MGQREAKEGESAKRLDFSDGFYSIAENHSDKRRELFHCRDWRS